LLQATEACMHARQCTMRFPLIGKNRSKIGVNSL
jgi:hypothetical protein